MLVVIIFALLSGVLAIRTIKDNVMTEAQNRVRLDLSSAWAVCNDRLKHTETIIKLVAGKQLVVDSCARQDWSSPELRNRLERIRILFHMDFLGIVAPDGKVVLRTTPPYNTGDYRASDPIVAQALAGKSIAAMALYSQAELDRESGDLAEKAFFELEDTPHARMTPRKTETRGMVMESAIPIRRTDRVLGVVYGGILANRNHELIDEIHNVVYKNETYHEMPLGTATIFLHDSRIATTVRHANGNRALGTRVSKEVANQVLDNGIPWVGEAFVVKDWYLTAYEPIRDIKDRIIGMLYVGILRQPFLDYGRSMIIRYVLLSLFVLLIALALSFILASRLAKPIHRLVDASNQMSNGETPVRLSIDGTCWETKNLIRAFNEMTSRLAEREKSLKATNHNYMETLSFVSHELKSPLGSVLNYVFLLGQKKLGPLSAKQQKAVDVIERNTKRLVEMVRHYLNLARIESHGLQPVPTRIRTVEDILVPLIESVRGDTEARGMRIENQVPENLELNADLSMTQEVFENLLGNAIKYGREGGAIVLKGSPKGAFVNFSVWNEGVGFPHDTADRLFQKFSRLSGSELTQRRRGTGLGLFITKHIVEAHGGTINARSKPGQWAEIVFTLPCYDKASSIATDSEPAGENRTEVKSSE